jgi:hypothetical protein
MMFLVFHNYAIIEIDAYRSKLWFYMRKIIYGGMKMKQVFKRLSWMLTLVMILSMLLPMGSVWAEGNNAVKVTVLGTTDLHGRIFPWDYATDTEDVDAGMAKLQTLVKQEKAANPNTILIDTGDTLQDNMADLFNNKEVHPMMEGLNYIHMTHGPSEIMSSILVWIFSTKT